MTDAIEAFLEPLLGTLDLIMLVQRHLHPPMAPRLAEALAPRAELVAAPLAALEGAQWPDDLQFMRDRLLDVGRQTVALVNAFVDAAGTPHDPIGLCRAMRRFALWHRLLGRPASESGRLCHRDHEGAGGAGGC